MDEYNPNEKYIGYHLNYYFRLMDVRKAIDDDIIQIKKCGENLIEKLQEVPINFPNFPDLSLRITNQIDLLLEQIAMNVNNRWKRISLDNHEFYHKSNENIKEIIRENYEGYRIIFSFPFNEDRPRWLVGDKLIEEMNILKSERYSIILFDCTFRIQFSSIDRAIEKTKEYLLKHR